jgi:hypothetical protein
MYDKLTIVTCIRIEKKKRKKEQEEEDKKLLAKAAMREKKLKNLEKLIEENPQLVRLTECPVDIKLRLLDSIV